MKTFIYKLNLLIIIIKIIKIIEIKRLTKITMAQKLIKGMDETLWRKFVAYCTIKGTTVAEEISIAIRDHMKKDLREVFK